MKRKIMDSLLEWKNRENRKPLILWGARQVGKTWSLQEFGNNYFDNTVYISFYNNKYMADIFEIDYDVNRIIKSIEIMMHVTIEPEKTLLIFDEVQGATKVVESLKYFCEDAPDYAVACAGSLLGVALHEGVSFPVGKVDMLNLYPMTFEEFLWALDEHRLAEYLKDYNNREINDFRQTYIQYLKLYYIVGGMPEAVKRYSESRNLNEVRQYQNEILHQYEGDFGKHIPYNQLPRINQVWNAIPLQLAKENKKFFFGQIKKGARSKDYETAIQWLVDCGLIYKVNKVSKPNIPLKAYINVSSFKLYLIDIGLLGALSELDYSSILEGNRLFVEFKGALTEQFVYQQLISETNYPVYYYSNEKNRYEVDFIIQKEGSVVPIEVKAEENLRSRSLRAFYDKYSPETVIRLSMAGMKKEDWLVNIPLWAVQSI